MNERRACRLTGVEKDSPTVVRTAPLGVAGAEARTRELLAGGMAVRLVVDCGRCSWDAVEAMARARLLARRAGVRLDVVVEDEALRGLMSLAGLSDLLDG